MGVKTCAVGPCERPRRPDTVYCDGHGPIQETRQRRAISPQLGRGLDSQTVHGWIEEATPSLMDGERILGVFKISKFKPLANLLFITSERLIFVETSFEEVRLKSQHRLADIAAVTANTGWAGQVVITSGGGRKTKLSAASPVLPTTDAAAVAAAIKRAMAPATPTVGPTPRTNAAANQAKSAPWSAATDKLEMAVGCVILLAIPAAIIVLLLGLFGAIDLPGFDASGTDSEDRFLADARSAEPQLDGVTDEELLDVGKTVCTDLDNGVTFDEFDFSARITGVDVNTAGAVIASAVENLCPEHEREMKRWLAG